MDSFKGGDFTPFRYIMNERYTRDTNKKIKFTFKARGMTCKHCAGIIFYGNLWDEKRKTGLWAGKPSC